MNVRLAAALFATFFVITGAGQAPGPKVSILYPVAGTYETGDILIKASVDPPSQPILRMRFLVDGRTICTVEQPPFECRWNAGSEVNEHGFHVIAYLPGGRRLADDVRTKGLKFVDNEDVRRIHVTVSVTDGGKFVRGLKDKDFRVYEDDVQQPITFFAPADENPLELVTAVDVSGSMTLAIEGVKENVKRFLSALRETDRVWLAGFNENFFIAARPSVDRAARLKAVDRLASWGMTSLYQIIIQSFDLLGKQQQSERRGLVIFSDGADTSSRVPREAVEARAAKSDAVLYMIGQGDAIGSPELKALCERLAEKSGGRAFFPVDLDQLRRAFDAIVEELSNQYLLGYAPPSNTRDSKVHRIRVEIPGRGYQVHHRQEYVF